ncbi:lysophospholipase [Pigmentiphaga aceris]|uniref:Lysophospholipase n=2 Tax=Pigmentiphaga aceris TaxID=1940612 RepID=A0A5C0B8I6_9BURK|nr:lysophospholipase [Pigmentiphaga aceris]
MVSTPDQGQLATYRWTPTAPAAGRGIYLLHGLGEHAGRYDTLGQWLAIRGWTVASHDHRGHGRSSGKRGVVRSADTLVEDAEFRIEQFADELGTAPVLLGHSLGGLVATQVALRNRVPLAGVVLSSPAFALRMSRWQHMLLDAVVNWAPNLRASNGLDTSKLSHEQSVIDAYREDLLVHDRISGRLAKAIEDGGKAAIAQAATLQHRTLLMVAGSDGIVDATGSRRFADAATPGRLALRWYDRAYHEIFNESPDIAAAVLADLEAWLAEV